MSSHSTVRLREILQTALDRPVSARSAFVADACGGDDELRTEVESLLAASEGSGAFLSAPEAWHCGAFPNLVEAPGTEVGRYTLQRLIGEGGFGAVFAARQEHPIKRTVALKIIKLGMDTRQVVARFHAERQALAMMDHAGIAKVYDAGATDTGRPYFVMELVDGVPITQYCDSRRLDIRPRLSLFVAVCEAVQHAHQKGIIHRDLKPTNILVTDADGRPAPKVIDFGIARAMQGRLTEHTLWTEQRQSVGTPQYMSPEQGGRGGADADTRSDVYSLGVVLYELLTGAMPFDARDLREKGPGEVERVIREVEPPRPSARVGGMEPAVAAQLAAGRCREPARLARRLKGELDWVVMKCLEKDRANRYGTAAALAEDLRRHLADEPVQAAAPSTWYRLKKFARRHKAGVAGGAAVAAALLGVIGTGVGLVRARTARALADKEVAAALPAKQFVSDRLGRDDADTYLYGVGRYVRVADVLDVESVAMAERFRDDPRGEIDGRFRLGRSYLALGMLEPAIANLERAHALALQHFGEDDERTLRIASRLVHAHRSRDAPGDGEPLARAAHAAALRRYGPANPRTLVAACDLADTLYYNKGESKQGSVEAELIYRQVLVHARRDPGVTPVQLAAILNNYAWVLYSGGRFDDAEAAAREAYDRAWSPGAGQVLPEVRAEAVTILAQICAAVGKETEGIGLYRRMWDHERARGLGLRWNTHQFAMQLAGLLSRSGDEQGALRVWQVLLEESLARAGTLRDSDPDVAACQAGVAEALHRSGQVAAAADAWVRAARIKGEGDPLSQSWRRIAVLAALFGTAAEWRSETVRGQVWCALDDLIRDQGWPTAGAGAPDWEHLRFRLDRAGAPVDAVAPVAAGGLAELKRLPEPGKAGCYHLTVELPRGDGGDTGGEPLRGQAGLLFCAWDVAVYVLPFVAAHSAERWREVMSRNPAERLAVGALAMDSTMGGPSGTVRRTSSTGRFGIVATAEIELPSGEYRFSVTSDDGIRLFVDDRPVIDAWTMHGPEKQSALVDLATGGSHRLKVEFFQYGGRFVLWLRAERVNGSGARPPAN